MVILFIAHTVNTLKRFQFIEQTRNAVVGRRSSSQINRCLSLPGFIYIGCKTNSIFKLQNKAKLSTALQ